jgi:hypothetical protein
MKKVYVYRNLHKKCWSVMDWKTKKVVEHCDEISLDSVVFKVSQAGRSRVNTERRKNVHAGVLGWVSGPKSQHSKLKNQVTYNPYTHEMFRVEKFDTNIETADRVYMNNGKVFV